MVWIEPHPHDDSEACAWCANFKCCMDPNKMIRRGSKLYCNDSCASADMN